MESVIRRRLEEFEKLGKKGIVTFDFKPFIDLKIKATIQTELAFCISTANSSAVSGLKFQKSLENSKNLTLDRIKFLLKDAGVRFWKRKADYIFEALRRFDVVLRALKMDSHDARNYLVKNVRGLGYKEASHFLRNVGRKDVAILDRHVLRWLNEGCYLDYVPENLSAGKYRKIEGIVKRIAKEMDVSLAELDLWIWLKKTGKILK